MAKPVRADHPEVIKLEYNGRYVRFRLIERIVYISVYDVKNLFRCYNIPYEELNIRCNSYGILYSSKMEARFKQLKALIYQQYVDLEIMALYLKKIRKQSTGLSKLAKRYNQTI